MNEAMNVRRVRWHRGSRELSPPLLVGAWWLCPELAQLYSVLPTLMVAEPLM